VQHESLNGPMKEAKSAATPKGMIDRFLFRSAGGEVADRVYRNQTLVSSSFIALFFMVPFWLARGFWNGFAHPTAIILAVCCLILLSAPILQRILRSVEVVGLYLTSTTALILITYSYFDGGFYSTALPWFPILPLFSVLFAGFTWGIMIGAFLLVTLIGFGMLHSLDLVPESNLLPWQTNFLYLLSTSAVLVLLIVLANLYVSWQRNIQKALVKANASKDEFLSGVSHELRTPLNSILGFAEVLQKEYAGKLTEEQREYVDLMHGGGTQLLALVDDLLDISAIDSGRLSFKPEPIAIEGLIMDVISMQRDRAGDRDIVIHAEIDESLGTENLLLDPYRFRQIISNLLSNAIKFSPDDGQIFVTATLRGNLVEICIEDEGPGVGGDDKNWVFDRFPHRGTEVDGTEGTGLGLALTKHFVQLHGGQIQVENRKDKPGALFKIKLPKSLTG